MIIGGIVMAVLAFAWLCYLITQAPKYLSPSYVEAGLIDLATFIARKEGR
jgi:hypothetical protein